jgi:hypothetical protein
MNVAFIKKKTEKEEAPELYNLKMEINKAWEKD